ncbi:MAG: threonylcarbamoyl-AMP synthase [Sphingomonadales bacterium 12-68-11]|nr:MAG: threonylcarbamoyl-AMP synthase [Sphingomonadales bacterium 12-68-11]
MSGKHTERLTADAAGIARAAAILRGGGLVAVPTETVYGLAARADSEAAVAAIYRAKGRPEFNPLIVHVASLAMARSLADLSRDAERLVERFWPGPLTLVVPRQGKGVDAAVTAGLPTVALRMPDHPAMRALLDTLGLPLAAPSANRSGAVSPTTAEHVAATLAGRIDAILDAGPCARGVESTIVALRHGGGWQMLRPGPIVEAEIAALLGAPLAAGAGGVEAPGQLASHYSPGKPVRLGAVAAETGEFLIGFGTCPGDCNLAPDGDLASAAARLYACLHEAAASPKPRVAVADIPDAGIGAAINDRLRRAAAPGGF